MAYIANTIDPGQTVPLRAVWTGFKVFASMLKVSLREFEFMQQT